MLRAVNERLNITSNLRTRRSKPFPKIAPATLRTKSPTKAPCQPAYARFRPSHPQEDLLAVQHVEQQPLDGHERNRPQERLVVARMLQHAVEKEVGRVLEVDDSGRQVNKDRVHADHHEEK